MEWLHQLATDDGSKLPKVSCFSIYPLKEYIQAMHSFVWQTMLRNPDPKPFLNYYIQLIGDQSTFEYNVDMMCRFHQKDDNQTKWCAKNCCVRMLSNIEPVLSEIYSLYQTAKQAPQQLSLQNQSRPQFSQVQQATPHDRNDERAIENGSQPLLAIMDH